jgi:uncharacterized membrane protein
MKTFKKVIWLIILLPAVYLLVIYNQLPAKVPMHYNLNGEIDRYGSKIEMIFMVAILSVVNFGVFLLLTNVHRIDPKKYAEENKDSLSRIAIATAVFLSFVLCLIIYSTTHPDILFLSNFILAGVGLLFCFLGNYMHSLKPNYFAGFRLPWTLESEENWRKTHLLGGKLWFGGGLLASLLCLILPFRVSIFTFFGIILILVIIPIVYSYKIYRKEKIIQRGPTA